MIRKLISEFVGTMLLVIFGCGTAVAVNTYVSSIYGVSLPFTMILIAAAFGLILMALAYALGKVSGCHVNPAVSIAMLINGRMSVLECIEYVVVQILGAIVGAEVLGIIFGSYTSLGANGYATLSALPNVTTLGVAITVEAILTFVFVLVVLSTTAKKNDNAGIVIGLTLCLVHIMGIPFTGTSVNPARSIGPALFTGGEALSQLWVFIVAPIIGAVLAALFYRFVIAKAEEVTEVSSEAKVEATEEANETVEAEKVEKNNSKTTKKPTKTSKKSK